MNTPLPIRIGLVGAGGIARVHVAGYLANAETIHFAAVADPMRENAERRVAEGGSTATITADYRDILRNESIDAVDICLPHHLHRDAIVAAAEAGKHVLCEKPLCLTFNEAHDVSAAVAASGVTVMCAHNQLFLPAVRTARQLIDNDALGTVYEVRTTDSFYNDFDPESMGWRAHAKTSGGGELIDTGYHPTYLLQHLAGGRPVAVAAMLATHRLRFMEGEDSANLIVRFDNGVVGTLTTSWAYEPAVGTERFSVVGERGSLTSDGTSLTFRERGGDRIITYPGTTTDTFAAELAHFAECLATGARPINTHEDGIATLGIILAAYTSAETGTIAEVAQP